MQNVNSCNFHFILNFWSGVYIMRTGRFLGSCLHVWRHTSGMTFWIRAGTTGGGEGSPAPPISQLWKQNFILTLWGGWDQGLEGWDHSFAADCWPEGCGAGLQIGVVPSGGWISTLCIEMLMKARTFSCNCSFAVILGDTPPSWIQRKQTISADVLQLPPFFLWAWRGWRMLRLTNKIYYNVRQ